MSSTRKPPSYGEAVAGGRKSVAAARLADSDDHFPYRRAAVDAIVEENPPMGPDGPDDDRVRAEDYMSSRIAAASDAYIAAQADYLGDPGDGTRAAYDSAKADLIAARQAHRANRPATGNVIGIRSRRAGE